MLPLQTQQNPSVVFPGRICLPAIINYVERPRAHDTEALCMKVEQRRPTKGGELAGWAEWGGENRKGDIAEVGGVGSDVSDLWQILCYPLQGQPLLPPPCAT